MGTIMHSCQWWNHVIASLCDDICFEWLTVISDPGGGAMFVQDPKKPAGGHVVAHASCVRLSLRKGKGEQRVCKIYDSPSMPENEATFQITSGGIADVKD